jgi:hypothetical protein
MRRKPTTNVAMCDAERQQGRCAKLRTSRPPPPPRLLARNAETIGACLSDGVPVDCASRIAASLQRRARQRDAIPRLCRGRIGWWLREAKTRMLPDVRDCVRQRELFERDEERSFFFRAYSPQLFLKRMAA